MASSKSPLTAVIFDLGGVLIDWNPRYLLRKLVAEDQVEWYVSSVLTTEWNKRLDAGLAYADGAAELVSLYPDHAAVIAAYVSRWDETVGGEVEANVGMLRRLRDTQMHLFALTNWSAETFPVALRRFEFLGWFSDILVSGEVGLVKPDQAIFRLAARRFGVDPRSTVFIDDSIDNVAAANSVGFEGIHFRTPEQLESDLSTLGLLNKADST
jgi:2-haloacid dehalogenase